MNESRNVAQSTFLPLFFSPFFTKGREKREMTVDFGMDCDSSF